MIEQCTALYSELDRQYQFEYCGGGFTDLSEKSDDGEIVAALKDGKITGFGRPMVCVGTDVFQLGQIERLWGGCTDIFYQDFLINGSISPITRFLLKKGYNAEPYYTQIVDLTKSLEELHADLRKSYKSLINNDMKNVYSGLVLGLDGLIQLHKEVADGETRSLRTWQIQGEMMDIGEATLFYSGYLPVVSGVLFYVNNIWAYYAVAASKNREGGHAVVWAAIEDCKKRGIKFLEMGEQKWSGDPKEVNISAFKRGFGGTCKVRLLLGKE